MYEHMKGQIVKVAKINNYIYHGRLVEEEADHIVVEDILIGHLRVPKKDIEKVIQINNIILNRVLDKLTPKISNRILTNENKMEKEFDKVRKEIKARTGG